MRAGGGAAADFKTRGTLVQGSKKLAVAGKVNVYGESTWDGIMSRLPTFVGDWSHPVKPDPARPPEHWLSGLEHQQVGPACLSCLSCLSSSPPPQKPPTPAEFMMPSPLSEVPLSPSLLFSIHGVAAACV